MRWFGFGFNAFGQIRVDGAPSKECSDTVEEVNLVTPTELIGHVDGRECCSKCERQIKACWSRTASLHLDGKSYQISICAIISATHSAFRHWCASSMLSSLCRWQPFGSSGIRRGQRVLQRCCEGEPRLSRCLHQWLAPGPRFQRQTWVVGSPKGRQGSVMEDGDTNWEHWCGIIFKYNNKSALVFDKVDVWEHAFYFQTPPWICPWSLEVT